MKQTNYLIQILIIYIILIFSSHLHAQSINVKGFIFADDDPAGLIGVNVLVKETLKGTATDFDGIFELSIEQSILPVTLEISYTGYDDQSIIITKAEPNLRIKMESGAATLDIGVEVKGQRIDEKRKANALTVESLFGFCNG